LTSVNPVHNAPRLSVTGPGIQADRARRGGWGRERSVTDRLGLALPDFDWSGPVWGVGKGVHSDGARRSGQPDLAWGWGREKSITDRPGPTLPDFDRLGPMWGVGEGEVYYRHTRPGTLGFRPTGPDVGGGGGRGLLQTDLAQFFARYFIGLSLPSAPKTFITDTKTYWIVYLYWLVGGASQVQLFFLPWVIFIAPSHKKKVQTSPK
jgi:hypothetical protein